MRENAKIRHASELSEHRRMQEFIGCTVSEEAALEVYQRGQQLNFSALSVISCIEVSVKSSACFHLDNYFGCTNWIVENPRWQKWKPSEKNNIFNAIREAKRKSLYASDKRLYRDKKQRLFPNGRPKETTMEEYKKLLKLKMEEAVDSSEYDPKDAIENLSMRFWKRLFSPVYEAHLWKTAVKRVFPLKSITRGEVAKHFEVIHSARNKIAHNGTVLFDDFDELKEAIYFFVGTVEARDADRDDVTYGFFDYHLEIMHRELAGFEYSYQKNGL